MPGQLSNRGFQFVAAHEGFMAKPAKAVSTEKYWTVGWGHYGPDVDPNRSYTKQECEDFFAQDKVRIENDVNKVWTPDMTQGMFDAMFSYAYNTGNISRSTLRSLIEDRAYMNVERLQTAWKKSKVTSGGKQLPGLVRRRADEVALFYSDEPDGGPFVGSGNAPTLYTVNDVGSGSQSSVSGTYGSPMPIGDDRYSTPNNYETYNSVLAGAQLNTTDYASLVTIQNEEENNKRTRIYQAGEVKIVVDELSMSLGEATIDTSTEKPTDNQLA